jgi:fumarate reductase flavoprotein subunit
MGIINDHDGSFETHVAVLVIGAGACGCCAGLAAHEAGAEVLILERDKTPTGSTSLSGGQIPAAGTKLQQDAEINDTPEILEQDLISKAKGQNDAAMAHHIAVESATTIDWLVDTHAVELAALKSFRYPGHSEPHMHATPGLHGSELLAGLLQAVERAGIDIVTAALVTDLFANPDSRVTGARIQRPDGTTEDVGCDALVLACNGYGGNPEMVARHIPDMADAHYHGHVGNQGDAVIWGGTLGARISDMGSYQGHGAVVIPHMVHLGWACITEGGFQVNATGERFSHENEGYSEQARKVLSQPDGVAWTIFDAKSHKIAMQLHSHRDAEASGGIHRATSVADLAAYIGCDEPVLAKTLSGVEAMALGTATDPFGRDFTSHPPLDPPYYVAKVTGALFHTQGGLEVDTDGRVLKEDGSPLPNLFAGGGAARGLSGPSDWGYLSGSGLLMATNLGRLAGTAAARLACRDDPVG